jgi:hypothetical protein
MARPSKHLITRAHNNKRYADKIRLLQSRGGPADDRFEAILFIDGKWQTHQPHGLGTRNFEEAHDKYCLLTKGRASRSPASIPRRNRRSPRSSTRSASSLNGSARLSGCRDLHPRKMHC